jgi:hypothetical protein
MEYTLGSDASEKQNIVEILGSSMMFKWGMEDRKTKQGKQNAIEYYWNEKSTKMRSTENCWIKTKVNEIPI